MHIPPTITLTALGAVTNYNMAIPTQAGLDLNTGLISNAPQAPLGTASIETPYISTAILNGKTHVAVEKNQQSIQRRQTTLNHPSILDVETHDSNPDTPKFDDLDERRHFKVDVDPSKFQDGHYILPRQEEAAALIMHMPNDNHDSNPDTPKFRQSEDFVMKQHMPNDGFKPIPARFKPIPEKDFEANVIPEKSERPGHLTFPPHSRPTLH